MTRRGIKHTQMYTNPCTNRHAHTHRTHTDTHLVRDILYIRLRANMKNIKKNSICLFPPKSDLGFFSISQLCKTSGNSFQRSNKMRSENRLSVSHLFLKAAQGCSLCPCKNYSCLRETVDVYFKRESASLPLNTGRILSVTLHPLCIRCNHGFFSPLHINGNVFASIIMNF